MVLSQEEIDGCREAFLAFDKDRSGTIDVWELRQVLEVQLCNKMNYFSIQFFFFENYLLGYGSKANRGRTFSDDKRS